MRAALSAGSAPATTRSDGIPTARPTDAATAGASPVTSHDSMPASASRRTASAALGRIGIGDDDHARERAIDRDENGRPRLFGCGGDRRSDGGIHAEVPTPWSSSMPSLPDEHVVAVDRRLDAVAGASAANAVTGRNPSSSRLPRATIARAERVLAAAFRGGRQVERARRRPCRRPRRRRRPPAGPSSACRSCRR